MNSNTRNHPFACPVIGCKHSQSSTESSFQTKNALLHHLNSTCHSTSLHLVDHSCCRTHGIYVCCTNTCPSSPKRFFSSERALAIHRAAHHQPPQPTPLQTSQDNTPANIATANILAKSTRNTQNHWTHGITFIENTYDHEFPDFCTSWRHMLRGRQKSSFLTLQSSILRCIVIATTTTEQTNNAAPF